MVICGEVPSRMTLQEEFPAAMPVLEPFPYAGHHHCGHFHLPSLDEPFGIATLEEMSTTGLPVLLHNNPHSVWLCGDKEQCLDMRNPQNIIGYPNDEETVK